MHPSPGLSFVGEEVFVVILVFEVRIRLFLQFGLDIEVFFAQIDVLRALLFYPSLFGEQIGELGFLGLS